mmetsp:Transcript_12026/g.25857  ORF Transcript_12026/g.25857 Transcript_12026/m.25857 type:complete len:121 (-) Transcript_12026:1384-1746(-)
MLCGDGHSTEHALPEITSKVSKNQRSNNPQGERSSGISVSVYSVKLVYVLPATVKREQFNLNCSGGSKSKTTKTWQVLPWNHKAAQLSCNSSIVQILVAQECEPQLRSKIHFHEFPAKHK